MYNEKIFIISLISCVFLTGCGSEEEVILKTERKVSTQLIGASNHSNIISLSGNITSTKTVKLSFEIPGTITDITVDEGDCVQDSE